ncbi:MAG TPA: GNAT family protein [Chitinophagaceae bacterium]|nr:GNAT family N-acetyltransferase [Chitinophagaceae bacterium]MCB9055993.1 GNAT family N-acetyltransferase [Chitinophagales bacterium]HPG10175.1 GNAT family protein [Chitinophagaceae bacterium]HRX93242.1 GNAT family protein [Chitinophagaceae bacterium]
MEFILRKWEVDDLDSLVEYANNYKIAKNLMNVFPHPYTAEDGIRFIETNSRQEPVQVFAITINNKACGAIGIFPQYDIMCKNAELGYWLAEPYWGNGIITKAIEQMVEYAFNTWNINRVYARPFGSNIASQKALEKAGFKLEAKMEKTIFKFGEYEDEYIYAIRK